MPRMECANLLSGLAKAVLLESRRTLEQTDQAFRLRRGGHLREPLGFVLKRSLSVHGRVRGRMYRYTFSMLARQKPPAITASNGGDQYSLNAGGNFNAKLLQHQGQA